MSVQTTYELAIVGDGIAGAAAALRAGQYNIGTAWILGDRETAKASRSKWVQNVDNMIGVHPEIVLQKLRDAWARRPDLLRALDQVGHLHITTQDIVDNVHQRLADYPGIVTSVPGAATALRRATEDVFEIDTNEPRHSPVRARAVVLATGVMDRQPLIAKEKAGRLLDRPHWIYPFANRESVLYCVRCEGHLTRDRRVAVIGASETAAQVALMLAERYGSACCLLANGEPDSIRPQTRRLLEHRGISIHPERLIDVLGSHADAHGLRGFVLEGGARVEVDFALVSLGLYRVYNDLARAAGAVLAEGGGPEEQRQVRIDSRGETSIPGLFAIGDLARRADEPVMMQIYTAQEYAVRAVDTIDRRRRERMRRAIFQSQIA